MIMVIEIYHFGGSDMNKKQFFSTALLMIAILLLSACSATKDSVNVTQATSLPPADEHKFLDTRLTETDYHHVMYGVFEDIHTLIGDEEVVVTAIRPVNKGGVDYDGYGWRTAFASTELFEDIGMETYISDDGTKSWIASSATKPRYWKLTMANCADGGGFVHLPEFIISAEEVDVDEIPSWGGA